MDAGLTLTERHRPQSVDDFIGNDFAVTLCRNFVESWLIDRPMKKVVILAGRNGIGKTSLPMAFAKDYRVDFVRFNASEMRTAQALKRFRENCITSTLSGKKKIMILDEADYLHKAARVQGLQWIISYTRNPVFITVNDLNAIPYATIRKSADVLTLKFEIPSAAEIHLALEKIVQAEGLQVKNQLLNEISTKLRTFRGAINALERGWVEEDDDYQDNDAYGLTERLLHGKRVNMNMQPDSLITWLYDNTYNGQEIFRLADRAIAHCNTLRATKPTTAFHFWRYAYQFLSQVRDAKATGSFPVTYTRKRNQKPQKVTDEHKPAKHISRKMAPAKSLKSPTNWGDYF